MKRFFLVAAVFALAAHPVFADSVTTSDRVASFVNVRKTPAADGEIVGRLAAGERREFIRTVDGWHEIALPAGGTGYVHGDWALVVVDPDPVASVDGESDGSSAAADDALAGPGPDAAAAADEAADGSREPPPTEEDALPAAGDPEQQVRGETELAEEPTGVPPEETAAVPPEETANVPPEESTATPPEVSEAAESPPVPAAIVPPETTVPLRMRGPDNFLVRFHGEGQGRASQVFDNGNFVGIGTTEPQQRLEVNGNIRINEQNSAVAGLMITQAGGETGYVLHNRASTLTIGAGSVDRVTIDRDGNVGIGESRPAHPLQMASGAYVTQGGVWTNASSRALKRDIDPLAAEEALAALRGLQPVSFRYAGSDPDTYLGFIAEDVPELVASADREGLSSMDIVAVLTRVIQSQQERIDTLEERLGTLETREPLTVSESVYGPQ